MNSALERLLSLQVTDVMRSQVVALSPDQTMADAANRLLQHEISGAPVIDEQGVCVGIISSADFVRREQRKEALGMPAQSGVALFSNRSPQAVAADSGDDERVRDHMTRGVRWVNAKDTLIDAARLMCEGHVHRLLVLDQNEHVAGVISSLDIVAAMVGTIEE